MTDKTYPDALAAGSTLLWYEILRVLGKGGFGITYLARDTNLDQLVAIKEYLPAQFAVRGADMSVQAVSDKEVKTYQWGLDRFMREAQLLARFKHAAIVRVLSIFRYANTAYMVMEYEEGEGLDAFLKRQKMLPESWIKRMLPPLLEGLATLHAQNIIHRDIKPPNIMIRKDGSPVILDFGSARQAMAGQNQQMTSLLSTGYSPFEQYDSSGARQGPWSDIYALGGVLYRSVTGRKPVDAAMRINARLRNETDPLVPAVQAAQGRYTPGFLRAIDMALAVMETERPQSIAAWQTLLFSGPAEVLAVPPAADPAPPPAAAVSPPAAAVSPPAVESAPAAAPPGPDTAAAQARKKKNAWRSFISSLNEFGTQVGEPVKPRPAAPAPVAPAAPKAVVEPVVRSTPPEWLPPPALSERRAGTLWRDPVLECDFVWMPPGSFIMGSAPASPGHKSDEAPEHEVSLDGFWMAAIPVTWRQWKKITGDPGNLYREAAAEHPAERILWEDTQHFMRQLMRRYGAKEAQIQLRLPTEAEWEYAARAGTRTLFYHGDDVNTLGEYAWYSVNASSGTRPVGRRTPNPWGLHDMLGNVWEWTADWYAPDAYAKRTSNRNPRGASFGEIRVVRGGSWRSQALALRVSTRNRVTAQSSNNALGFRLVKVETGKSGG
ncbi:MAG: bifunctional serine/threonine-protein kinase/formylglycine-generating enzyme family protein [Magnetococcus sp. WYHC-3]